MPQQKRAKPTDSGKNKSAKFHDGDPSASHLALVLVDLQSILAMVFGGCCTNVWAYEQLLLLNPRMGSALTFSQMLFITLHSLPSFLLLPTDTWLPKFKSRQVPLYQWALQVLVLTSGSLLNNWAFAYKVPLTVQIVFRSAGLGVSMVFGYLFMKKKYNVLQIFSVSIVTFGVILVTLSRSDSSSATATPSQSSPEELRTYKIGVAMLVISLFCTGFLGILQEQTYRKYGPCWKEGVFYTHFLSLPIFLFLGADVKQGIAGLFHSGSVSTTKFSLLVLFGNLVSQLICVSGVNRLTSHVSSVSTNLALTVRKAISLCFSVWWFGNQWNARLGIGATLVFFGSLLYTTGSDKLKKE